MNGELVQMNISLLGRHFTVAAPKKEEEALLDAARMLNEKAQTIRSQGRIIDSDKIAILAALNIAHDFLKTKVGEGLEIGEFRRKIRNMITAADDALHVKREEG